MSAYLIVQIAHWLAAVVVVVEALNKLERTDVLARGLGARARLVEALKAAAWFLLAVGGGGTIAAPLVPGMPAEFVALQHACVMGGVAVLIVRTRVKEAVTGQPQSSDDFTQTKIIRRPGGGGAP